MKVAAKTLRLKRCGNSTIIFVASVILGVIWLWSGIAHWTNPWFFLESILNYRIFGGVGARLFAAVILVSSFVIGTSLITGSLRSGATLLSSCLLVMFLIAQISVLFRGIEAGCGCFGAIDDQIGLLTIARTTAFLVLSFWLTWELNSTSENIAHD